MRALLKIVVDVVVYRLRHFEMANLAAALAVMVALRLSAGEIVVRGAFAFVLNVLAYLVNDVVDLEQDLASGRAPEKTRFLAEHKSAALAAEALLAFVLVAIALVWSPWLLVVALAGAGICWVYSAYLKRLPYADVLAMTAWGAAMPAVAVPPDRVVGWLLVGQLALFSTVFELIQVLRDEESDREHGIHTTAVALGPARTLVAIRVAMSLAAVYAVLAVHRFIGLGLLLALVVPAKVAPERYWNRVRLVFGLVWLALIGAIAVSGATDGALGRRFTV